MKIGGLGVVYQEERLFTMAKSKKHSKRDREPRRYLYNGVFSAAAAGFGFVKTQDDPPLEFFIPRKYTGHALDCLTFGVHIKRANCTIFFVHLES